MEEASPGREGESNRTVEAEDGKEKYKRTLKQCSSSLFPGGSWVNEHL